MGTRDDRGRELAVTPRLPVMGVDGISTSETSTEINVDLDIGSLPEKPSPSVSTDYLLIAHDDGTHRRSSLAAVLGAAAASANVSIYSEPGRFSWSKPTGAKWIRFIAIAGGGGGGSGGQGSAPGGGAGGAGGALAEITLPADIVASTVRVFVGRGGTGARSPRGSEDATAGVAGTAGQDSFVGALAPTLLRYVTAVGGPGGQGGPGNSSSSGANAPTSSYWSGGDGGDGNRTADSEPGESVPLAAAGGGGGGTAGSDGLTLRKGGDGGVQLLSTDAAPAGGPATGVGVDGEDGASYPLLGLGAQGGAGGGFEATTGNNAGDGGNGGTPGGGGGGGGGTVADSMGYAGAGGDGGNGLVIVIAFY